MRVPKFCGCLCVMRRGKIIWKRSRILVGGNTLIGLASHKPGKFIASGTSSHISCILYTKEDS